MSEAELKVEFPDEKLDALRYFTEKNGGTVEDKLKEYLDKTYEKVVPQQVRDYVENRSQAVPARKESSDIPASDMQVHQPRQTRRQQREQAAAEVSALPPQQPEESGADESEGQGMSLSM
jgi:hypothetical protein